MASAPISSWRRYEGMADVFDRQQGATIKLLVTFDRKNSVRVYGPFSHFPNSKGLLDHLLPLLGLNNYCHCGYAKLMTGLWPDRTRHTGIRSVGARWQDIHQQMSSSMHDKVLTLPSRPPQPLPPSILHPRSPHGS